MQDFLKGRSFVLRPWWQRWPTVAIFGTLLLAISALLMLPVASSPVPQYHRAVLDREELAKFQGAWEVIAREQDGVAIPLEPAQESPADVRGAKLRLGERRSWRNYPPERQRFPA